MLVLSRKVGEQIVIGDNITVVVNKVAGNRISLGISAPSNVRIMRGELKEAVSAFDDDDANRSRYRCPACRRSRWLPTRSSIVLGDVRPDLTGPRRCHVALPRTSGHGSSYGSWPDYCAATVHHTSG